MHISCCWRQKARTGEGATNLIAGGQTRAQDMAGQGPIPLVGQGLHSSADEGSISSYIPDRLSQGMSTGMNIDRYRASNNIG